MSEIVQSLRQAVKASEKTQYRLAKEAKVAQSMLSRLLSRERGLSIEAAERLADVLGLELVLRPKTVKKTER
ncbi:MAG: helix-turn-helix transcriptional regulator [Planctomycetes bacterium]|nr:helix-turn-helix transcriptional regulator [Planctomycetota bacterium]